MGENITQGLAEREKGEEKREEKKKFDLISKREAAVEVIRESRRIKMLGILNIFMLILVAGASFASFKLMFTFAWAVMLPYGAVILGAALNFFYMATAAGYEKYLRQKYSL